MNRLPSDGLRVGILTLALLWPVAKHDGKPVISNSPPNSPQYNALAVGESYLGASARLGRLRYITFCYNTSVHSGTQYTPYFLVHGVEACWNIDLLLDNQQTAVSVNEHAANVSQRLTEAYRLARENLGTAAAYSKGWYDRRASGREFSEGDEVRVLDSKGYTYAEVATTFQSSWPSY